MIQLINKVLGIHPKTHTHPVVASAAQQLLQQAPSVPLSVTPNAAPSTPTKPQPTSPLLKKVKLIMVTANNNNKFYDMEENADGTFTVSYGRIGSHAATQNYPMSQWERKKREKIRKGYKDTTYLFAEKDPQQAFLKIPDSAVKQLMDQLMKYAQQSVTANYHVSSEQVTLQQVQEAQAILDKLSQRVKFRMRTKAFNERLTELYTIIPRRMTKVQDHLISSPKTQEDLEAIEKKLADEQATLDVMRGQVEMHQKQNKPSPTPQTLLDTFGIHIEPLNDAQTILNIKKMMGPKANIFHKAYKVVNYRTQQQFDQHLAKAQNKKTELFWHGSRNGNWLSILKSGLQLRPANAIINGKMFGYGLYFADKFAKSLNYTSLRGSYWTQGSKDRAYLALYEVHVGKQLPIKRHQSWCYQLSESTLKAKGADYNSVYAKGGADLINNEYIIYNQNQCTVKYIVEVR